VAELDDVVDEGEGLLDLAPVLGFAVEACPDVLHDEVVAVLVEGGVRDFLERGGWHVPLLVGGGFVQFLFQFGLCELVFES